MSSDFLKRQQEFSWEQLLDRLDKIERIPATPANPRCRPSVVRSIVLVVVLIAFHSPAEAFTLAFTDDTEVSLPTNGGIWVTGYA